MVMWDLIINIETISSQRTRIILSTKQKKKKKKKIAKLKSTNKTLREKSMMDSIPIRNNFSKMINIISNIKHQTIIIATTKIIIIIKIPIQIICKTNKASISTQEDSLIMISTSICWLGLLKMMIIIITKMNKTKKLINLMNSLINCKWEI